MSITKHQNPFTQTMYIHQTEYPRYYTAASTEYTQSDMKYKFGLNTYDGLISTSKNPPYITNGLGVYNPNKYLQNLLDDTKDFNPTISYWTPCTNSIINYKVSLDEYYSSAVQNSTDFVTSIGINVDDENFDDNWTDYLMGYTSPGVFTGQGKFLNKFTSSTTRKIGLTDEYGTVRFLSGNFSPAGNNYKSLIYEMIIALYRPSQPGYINYYRYQYPNPWYSQTTSSNQLSSTNLLNSTDMGRQLIEFPVGPKTLNSMNWNLVGATTPSGYVPYYPPYNPLYNLQLYDGDIYYFQTYAWPYGVNGRTSEIMKFEVSEPCNQYTNIQLQWKNSLGGYDFYRFDKVATKSHNINRSNYRKVRDTIDGMGTKYNNYIGHDSYDRGETTFNNDIETMWTLNSNWLTDEELLALEDLWYSKDVYAYIDEFYPVVITSDSIVINSDQRGLRQYQFEIRLSNKKYN